MAGIGNYDVQYTLILHDKMTKVLKQAENATKGFNSYVTAGGNQLASMFSKGNIAMGVMAGGVALMGKAIKNAMDFEQTQISFEVLLGSADKATKMLKELEEFAIKTPFESKDLLDSTKLLLNFGVAQKKIMPLMQQLGDITAGDANKLHSMSLAFGQMSSTGRLMGQDLNQMINAGFNPLEYIAKRTGKTIAELKVEMEKGKISVEMVEQAFADATGEGGRFNGMMEKQSESMGGQWSTAVDKFNVSLRKIGQVTLPELTSSVKSFNAIMDGDFRSVFSNIADIQQHSIYTVQKWGMNVLGMNTKASTSYFDLSYAVEGAANMTSTQLTDALEKAQSVYGATNQQVEYFLSLMNKQKQILGGSKNPLATIDESTTNLEAQINGLKQEQDKLGGGKDDMKKRKEIQKDIDARKKELDRRDKTTSSKMGGGSSTVGGGTTISSRAPQYFTITIDQLVGTINTKKESFNESDTETKKQVTEALVGALNDTQLIGK